jgi:large subunit ribosomal protein L21
MLVLYSWALGLHRRRALISCQAKMHRWAGWRDFLIPATNCLLSVKGSFTIFCLIRQQVIWRFKKMYAVIKTGGKQYKAALGGTLKVESLDGEVGQAIKFDQVVLLVDGEKIHVGKPLVAGASVSAEVVAQDRHKKIKILKFKRRKQHMKRQGHRQNYTEILIKDINVA